jgi:hypothetical protein
MIGFNKKLGLLMLNKIILAKRNLYLPLLLTHYSEMNLMDKFRLQIACKGFRIIPKRDGNR